ncbi:hypothetical protein Scep_020531 [Stephania cephalantha]|uniref:Uncharacterized protein n=1 Tax=Stephania cephalantha TaxID=152367 RepID=A0AAP0IE28_9MAGN
MVRNLRVINNSEDFVRKAKNTNRPSLEKSSQRPALGGIINGIELEVLVEVFFPELVNV